MCAERIFAIHRVKSLMSEKEYETNFKPRVPYLIPEQRTESLQHQEMEQAKMIAVLSIF